VNDFADTYVTTNNEARVVHHRYQAFKIIASRPDGRGGQGARRMALVEADAAAEANARRTPSLVGRDAELALAEPLLSALARGRSTWSRTTDVIR